MPDSLQKYNQKRNFDNTSEPQGKRINEKEKKGDLKFCVHHHIARREHYDLRLEHNGVLLSWAVPKGPSYNPRDKRLAVKVEDHPFDYRNFEGTIPKGQYGGGVVMLWDEGSWNPLSDVEKGLKEGSLKFELNGIRLKGKWAIVKLKENDDKDNWILIKDKDSYSQNQNGISHFNQSIKTGRTMAEIEKGTEQKNTKNPFTFADVQLAKLAKNVPVDQNWLYEVKYDGYRILAFIEGNNVTLLTRNNKDFTHRFKDIAASLISWANGRAMVLDGEAVITDSEGKTDFQALQNHMKKQSGNSPAYIVFDILAFEGKDLRQYPLTERKAILDNIMSSLPYNIHCSKYVLGKGKESFNAACKLNLEGIIGKRLNSKYSGTRNDDWIKLKCGKRQEFVIAGYTLSDKKKSGVSSLLLGVYEGKNLIYTGRVGTGFTQKLSAELEEKFKSIISQKSYFINAPKQNNNEKITWLKPLTVCEVNFAEWTKENLLRQASFKGLREDKNPKEITMEKEQITELNQKIKEKTTETKSDKKVNTKGSFVNGIKITNPDKIIFENPLLKKIDVINYYKKVADRIMPYVSGRILSIVRCPKGIDSPCFYKKHPGSLTEGIAAIPVTNSKGETNDYFYINSPDGLISETQMGTLEFHIWGSRIDDIEKPDIMVFDLDPDEDMDLDTVRRGAEDLKNILDGLSLKSFLKTSGGKGYHVVLPFLPQVKWDVFHDFAKGVAEVMETKWPDNYTTNIRKEKRKGKIFIDWVRNGRGATSIAPYSLRAKKGATVSMPIKWQELYTVAPNGITINDALERINKSDPWKDFYKIKQQLNFKDK